MSQEGIKIAADIFSQMQSAREQLIRMACRGRPVDKQDLLLGHMFSKANDAIKDDFMQIISDHYPDTSGYIKAYDKIRSKS